MCMPLGWDLLDNVLFQCSVLCFNYCLWWNLMCGAKGHCLIVQVSSSPTKSTTKTEAICVNIP